jgi:hypothetical protein
MKVGLGTVLAVPHFRLESSRATLSSVAGLTWWGNPPLPLTNLGPLLPGAEPRGLRVLIVACYPCGYRPGQLHSSEATPGLIG